MKFLIAALLFSSAVFIELCSSASLTLPPVANLSPIDKNAAPKTENPAIGAENGQGIPSVVEDKKKPKVPSQEAGPGINQTPDEENVAGSKPDVKPIPSKPGKDSSSKIDEPTETSEKSGKADESDESKKSKEPKKAQETEKSEKSKGSEHKGKSEKSEDDKKSGHAKKSEEDKESKDVKEPVELDVEFAEPEQSGYFDVLFAFLINW